MMKEECFECGQECEPKYKRNGVYFCSDKCVEAHMGLGNVAKTCCVCGTHLIDSIYIDDDDRSAYCSFECALKEWGIEHLATRDDSKDGKAMDSHNHMRCKCSVCNNECLPQYTIGCGISQLSFCSEECLARKLGLMNKHCCQSSVCEHCGKEFIYGGIYDYKWLTYCSTECAYWHNDVVQHIYEKGHEDGNIKTCEGSLKEKCAACGTVCMPKYTIGYGLGQKAFCSEQCLREWAEILDIEDVWNKVFTCSKCGKTFWNDGVRDRACHYFCSTDCAYRYKGVAQYEVVTMDKEKEQQYEQRIKTLQESIDELQKEVNRLRDVEKVNEKKYKGIKLDYSAFDSLRKNLIGLDFAIGFSKISIEETECLLKLLGWWEKVKELSENLNSLKTVIGEVLDLIRENKC